MDQETQKGITKVLSTLPFWGNKQIIGYKSEEKDFRKIVTKIWFNPEILKILGWCPAGPVLPHGEKVPL